VAKLYDGITTELQAFIEAQPLFFVATAPLAASGHVNLSPKGMDCLRVLSSDEVVYLDLTGSGNETSAHIAESGRITLMFCAFAGPPRILRLYGQGRTIVPGTQDWDTLRPQFPHHPSERQIIAAKITRVQTSCGFGVPLMEYTGQRDTLTRWAEAKGADGIAQYRQEKNALSIDGLVTPLKEHGCLGS
jgi:hypothetical protein